METGFEGDPDEIRQKGRKTFDIQPCCLKKRTKEMHDCMDGWTSGERMQTDAPITGMLVNLNSDRPCPSGSVNSQCYGPSAFFF